MVTSSTNADTINLIDEFDTIWRFKLSKHVFIHDFDVFLQHFYVSFFSHFFFDFFVDDDQTLWTNILWRNTRCRFMSATGDNDHFIFNFLTLKRILTHSNTFFRIKIDFCFKILACYQRGRILVNRFELLEVVQNQAGPFRSWEGWKPELGMFGWRSDFSCFLFCREVHIGRQIFNFQTIFAQISRKMIKIKKTIQ